MSVKKKNPKPKFKSIPSSQRHRVLIKGTYLLSKDDREFIADTCRSIIYRKSGHGYSGYRGMYDEVICNRFGFSIYVDSKDIRDRICLILIKRFTPLSVVKVVKGSRPKIGRDHCDVYRLVA